MACLGAVHSGSHPLLDCRAADGFPSEWDAFHEALGGATATMEDAAAAIVHAWYPAAQSMCMSYEETDWFTSFQQSDFNFAGIASMTGLLVFSQYRPMSTLNGFCLLGFVTALVLQACA